VSELEMPVMPWFSAVEHIQRRGKNDVGKMIE
jgi:hypothetical protein